ncbi:MAG: hypothetical protein IKD55_13295 [Sediminibacterium sp.]|nr:hypothetical protein [Sediminibacterium sp.]
MFHFCFNDSIPKDGTNDGLVKHLSVTLIHYDKIKRRFPTSVNGIITDRLPEKVYLNTSEFSLSDCIEHLDRELKIIACANFGKYPVDDYYNQFDIDSLLANEYTITVNKIEHDATNAKIVQENGGILFTLPIHKELENNTLVISGKEKQTCDAINQYGSDTNTNFISDYIQDDIVKRAAGFDKLIAFVGACKYDARFKSDFDNLTFATQKKLLSHVHQSIERKAETRFYPDDKKIKDVTPHNEKSIKVFELRVFEPVAVRMYFYETPKKIYFGCINGKPKKKVQDNDILNAASIIKELIILDKS